MTTKSEKSVFEKKYITEAQARTAANKAGVADIAKFGSVWMMVQPKPVKAPKAVNKTPASAEKRGRGRPISEEAVKVRRRTLTQFQKMVAANDMEVTVKGVTKVLRLDKSTVSNTIRWAENAGLIKREGFKEKTGVGRKEVFYTLQPKKLEKFLKSA